MPESETMPFQLESCGVEESESREVISSFEIYLLLKYASQLAVSALKWLAADSFVGREQLKASNGIRVIPISNVIVIASPLH